MGVLLSTAPWLRQQQQQQQQQQAVRSAPVQMIVGALVLPHSTLLPPFSPPHAASKLNNNAQRKEVKKVEFITALT
jgi:hypothetical protein